MHQLQLRSTVYHTVAAAAATCLSQQLLRDRRNNAEAHQPARAEIAVWLAPLDVVRRGASQFWVFGKASPGLCAALLAERCGQSV
jgi:hypothetical protein